MSYSISKLSKTIAFCFGVLIMSFLVGYLIFAWTEPSEVPPGCTPGQPGCDAPINVGPSSQYKSGALGIGGVFRAYSNAIFDSNVGIGTTGLGAKLDVLGTTYPVIRGIRSTVFTNIPRSGLTAQHRTSGNMVDGFGADISFEIRDNAGVNNEIADIGAVRDGEDNSGAIFFATFNTGTWGERVRITKTGNVGIGTTTPESTLTVRRSTAGNVFAIRNTVDTANNFIITDTGVASMTGFRLGASATAGYILTADASGVGTWQAAAGGGIGGSGTAAQVAFFTSSTTIGSDNSLYWDNTNKRLGIGTTNPVAKLQISGDITNNYFRPFYIQMDGGAWDLHTGIFSNSNGYGVAIGAYPGDVRGSISAYRFTNGYGSPPIDLILNREGGNVGIGGSKTPLMTPLVKLDVRGANTKGTTAAFGDIFQVASTDATGPLTLRMGIKTDATAANRYGAIEVDDAGTKKNLILQSAGGNVGIGTASPNTTLNVNGNISAYGSTETIYARNTQTGGYTFLGYDNVNDRGRLGAYSGGWKNLVINEGGGNVGIGTTDPGTNKLKVDGNTEITGNLNVSGRINFQQSGITSTKTCAFGEEVTWAVTFLQTFSATPVVLVTAEDLGAGGISDTYVSGVSTTGFTLRLHCATANTVRGHWMALRQY